MAALKHDHKLKRHTYTTGNEVFFCTLPDCTYKVKIGLSLGKRVICWRCDKPFLMTDYALRLSKPHCQDCHIHKDKTKNAWVGPVNKEAYEALQPVVDAINKSNSSEAAKVTSSLRDRMSGAVRALEEEGEI